MQLEKEIAEEERNNSGDSGLSSLLSWQFQASPPRMDTSDLKMRHSRYLVFQYVTVFQELKKLPYNSPIHHFFYIYF